MNDTCCTSVRKSDYGTKGTCVFYLLKKEIIMPKNQFQRMVFAFITVVITVHAYVFFSLYVIHGNMFMQITGESDVLAAISKMGGV